MRRVRSTLAVIGAASLIGLGVAAGPAVGASLRSAPTAHAGKGYQVTVRGFPAGAVVALTISPTSAGMGNCCGVRAGGKRRVSAAGKAVFRFRFPLRYFFCAGGGNCSKVAWTRERARLFVVATDPAVPGFARRTIQVIPPA